MVRVFHVKHDGPCTVPVATEPVGIQPSFAVSECDSSCSRSAQYEGLEASRSIPSRLTVQDIRWLFGTLTQSREPSDVLPRPH